MTKTTGVVEEIREREARNGGKYAELRLAGKTVSLFDWTEDLLAGGVQPGDEVAVEHSGGRYPRIQNVKKLNGNGAQARRPAEPPAEQLPSRDVLIIRQSCLKAAIELLAQSDLDYASKEMALARLARDLEAWVRRPDRGPE